MPQSPGSFPFLVADDLDASTGRAHQGIIDAEMRATRRAILATFRRRLLTDVETLAADDFLRIADLPSVGSAFVLATGRATRADAYELRVYDAAERALRILGQYGLPAGFVTLLPVRGDSVVLHTGDEVSIRGPAASVLEGAPAASLLRTAGFRTVQCHPLRDPSRSLLGVLSLHYRTAGRHPAHRTLARSAERALAFHTSGARRRSEPPNTTLTTASTAEDVTTLTVHGPLDAVSAPRFAELIAQTLTDSPTPRTVVVDLREADFLAVAGARAVLDAHELCRARAVECVVIAEPDTDSRMILTRLAGTTGPRVIDNAIGRQSQWI